jgi:hypothetical protein
LAEHSRSTLTPTRHILSIEHCPNGGAIDSEVSSQPRHSASHPVVTHQLLNLLLAQLEHSPVGPPSHGHDWLALSFPYRTQQICKYPW